MATKIFSCVKITYFHTKAHLVFHWHLYNNTKYSDISLKLL